MCDGRREVVLRSVKSLYLIVTANRTNCDSERLFTEQKVLKGIETEEGK